MSSCQDSVFSFFASEDLAVVPIVNDLSADERERIVVTAPGAGGLVRILWE
jgi:hypothetical protein